VAGRCVRATTRVEPLPLMQVEMDGRSVPEPLSFWISILQYSTPYSTDCRMLVMSTSGGASEVLDNEDLQIFICRLFQKESFGDSGPGPSVGAAPHILGTLR